MGLHPNDPRFLREAELLRRIFHPHIPRLHDHGLCAHPAGPFPFLAMDWVDGVPLLEWARSRPLTSRHVLLLLAPLADALAATHAVQGVHRDVKDGNILVRLEDSWPTLLDFGAGDFLGAPTLTRDLLPPGTAYHRSPEALRFHWLHRHLPGSHYEPGPADDVYALGVTAYCLVTGTYPHPVLPAELLASEPSFAPPVWEPPEQLVTVCPELATLIRQMLAQAPSARGSAAELAQALGYAARTAESQADQFILPRPKGQGEQAPRTEALSQATPGEVSQANPPCEPTRVVVLGVQEARPAFLRSIRARVPGLAVAAGLVAFFALQEWAQQHWVVLPERSAAQHQRDNDSEDSGTSGLGSDALSARVDTEEPEPSGKEIGIEFPNKPLPGQALPPCKRREIEINGGCWKRSPEPTPPCAEREYEWRGLCYSAVLAPPPPATSKQR